MFAWFATKCPLETWEKTWIESRMGWLAQKLGIDRMLNAEVVLPTDRHFPDEYKGNEVDVFILKERVCGFMGIDPDTVIAIACDDQAISGAAGRYQLRTEPGEKSVVHVAASQLAEPMKLVATLTHELAHEVLLGGGILDVTVGDHEWIADLLQVFLGLGVFAANDTVYEQNNRNGDVSWWVMGKRGYLPSRMFGYALALFVCVRGEKWPVWGKHLRRDARKALEAGLRYLWKTGDSLFRPAMDHRPPPLSIEEAVVRLRTGTATVRLATLWEIERQGLTTTESLAAVAARLSDPDPSVVGDAARLLPRFGNGARSAVPALLGCLDSPSEGVRAGACEALGELGTEEATVKNVAFLLRDESRSVVRACAIALTRLGVPLDEGYTADLLGRLEQALIECDDPLVEILASALLATSADPKRRARDYFEWKDAELRRLCFHAIEESALQDDADRSPQRPLPLPERLPF